MKTITETSILIESLKELLNAGKGHQLTAREIINGRTHINGQWQTVKFSNDFYNEVIPLIAGALGGRASTQKTIEATLRFSRPQHWGLDRIFFREYKDDKTGADKIYCSYCAGQDGQYETKQIRKFLTK